MRLHTSQKYSSRDYRCSGNFFNPLFRQKKKKNEKIKKNVKYKIIFVAYSCFTIDWSLSICSLKSLFIGNFFGYKWFCFYDEYHMISTTLVTCVQRNLTSIFVKRQFHLTAQKHQVQLTTIYTEIDAMAYPHMDAESRAKGWNESYQPDDFPDASEKLSREMNDRSAIEDTEAKLIAGLVPTISSSRSRKEIREIRSFLKSRVAFSTKISWLFRRQWSNFTVANPLNSQILRRALFPFRDRRNESTLQRSI